MRRSGVEGSAAGAVAAMGRWHLASHDHHGLRLLLLLLPLLPLPLQDIAGLVKGASKGEGLGNQFLATIRECDSIVQVRMWFGGVEALFASSLVPQSCFLSLCSSAYNAHTRTCRSPPFPQVVRCFDDADVIHVSGKVGVGTQCCCCRCCCSSIQRTIDWPRASHIYVALHTPHLVQTGRPAGRHRRHQLRAGARRHRSDREAHGAPAQDQGQAGRGGEAQRGGGRGPGAHPRGAGAQPAGPLGGAGRGGGGAGWVEFDGAGLRGAGSGQAFRGYENEALL